ncbi:MAG: hypothetical protein V7636_2793 [Actinomycetota bacterium]
MSRLIALVVAAGLIVAAILIRGVVDDDSNDSSQQHDGPIRVVCATEIYAACAALDPGRYEARGEDAAVTARSLSGDDEPDFDVWIAPSSWPGIVDDARTRTGGTPTLVAEEERVARSPIVVVGGDGVAGCDWHCIGGKAFSLGAASPSSGLGTLELGAAATGYFGRSTFAANDLDTAFGSWLEGMTERVVTNDQPVTTLLQSRAFFDVAISTEADAKTELDAASADRKAGLSLQYPAPVAYVDVVAVDVDPARARVAAGVARTVGSLLESRGWKAPSSSADGLPRPGVLAALRELL